MSVKPISPKTEKVYQAIKKMIAERHGLSPSIRDIQTRLQFRSPNGVQWHLARLDEAGLIIWERGVARGVLLPSDDERSKLLGRLATLSTEDLWRAVEANGV